MPVDAVIFTRASAFTALTALVPSTRFLPEKELTGNPALPYVTYTLVSTVESYLTFSLPTDFERDDQYRFNIWASSHDSALDVAKQIILAFHGYTTGTYLFIFDSETEIPEEEEFVFHRVLDFVAHSENDNS